VHTGQLAQEVRAFLDVRFAAETAALVECVDE